MNLTSLMASWMVAAALGLCSSVAEPSSTRDDKKPAPDRPAAATVERIHAPGASAAKLAEAIRTLLGRRATGASLVVAADPAAGCVLISGPPNLVRAIHDLAGPRPRDPQAGRRPAGQAGAPAKGPKAAAVETSPDAPFENLRVVHLCRFSAKGAVQSLHDVFKDEAGLRVGHNSERNAVILRGQPKLLDQAEHVLAELEAGATPTDNDLPIQAIRFKHAQAQEAVPVLIRFFGRRAGGDADIECDVRTNSILVRCRPETLERVRTVVHQIDVVIEPASREPGAQKRAAGRRESKPAPPPTPAEPPAERREPRT